MNHNNNDKEKVDRQNKTENKGEKKDEKDDAAKESSISTITQSPSAERRPMQMITSNKKKRYYRPISELLASMNISEVPTLTQIVETKKKIDKR